MSAGFCLLILICHNFVLSMSNAALGAETGVAEKTANLKVFSMIAKKQTSSGIHWVETFYLLNDGVNAVSVTSASITMSGKDKNGRIEERTSAVSIGGSSTKGKGISVVLNSNMIWQFTSIEWEQLPGEATKHSRASYTSYRNEILEITNVKSIRRCLLLVHTD